MISPEILLCAYIWWTECREKLWREDR